MSARIDFYTASPDAMKAMLALEAAVGKLSIERPLLELVRLRVSQINGCAFCLDMHTRDLLKKGLTPVKLALVQVWDEAGDVFTEREKAALAWAETVTRVSETHVPDAAFKAASAVFEDKELADLTMAIGLINAYNRLAISFRNVPQEATESK